MPSTEPAFRVVIFADCHLPVESGHPDFEVFLHTFKQVAKQTEIIVLLGDVFQVWAAVPVFDHENGHVLLKAIQSVPDNCQVIMVEGNWDFYIKDHYSEYFDEISEDAISLESREEQLVFVHGHMDHLFLDRLLTKILKSKPARWFFRRKQFSGLARKLNRKFQEGELSKQVRPGELLAVARRLARHFPNSDHIFIGHFHTSWHHGNVTVVPDYHSTRSFLCLSDKPAIYRFENNEISPVNSDGSLSDQNTEN